MSSYPPPTINTVFNVADYPDAENGNIVLAPPYVNNGVAVYKSDAKLHTSSNLIFNSSDDLLLRTKPVAVQSPGMQDFGIVVYSADNQQIESYNKLSLSYDGRLTVGVNNNPSGLINACHPYANFNTDADLLAGDSTPRLSFIGQDTTNYNNVLYKGGDRGVHLALAKDTDFTSGLNIRNIAGVSLLADSDGVGSNVRVYTNNSSNALNEVMRIDSSGRIGVGTTSPLCKLHVVGNSTAPVMNNATTASSYNLFLQAGGSNPNTSCGIAFGEGTAVNCAIMAYDAGTTGKMGLSFYTLNSLVTNERMRIDNLGNVGIGTTTALAKLHVKGDSTNYDSSIVDTTGLGCVAMYKELCFSGEGRNWYQGAGDLSGAENQRFVLLSSDSGGGNTPYVHLGFDALADQLYVKGKISATEGISIGVSTPTEKLDVNGDVKCTAIRESILIKDDMDYTILSTDPTYILTGTTPLSTFRIFTLPLASACTGKRFVIKDQGMVNAGNVIGIVRTSPDTIEGGTTIFINSAWGSQDLLSTGTNWIRLNSQ